MLIASVSDFKKNIKSYLDKVSKNVETLIIDRGNESGVVVMTWKEYSALMATKHEVSSQKNELHLNSEIENLDEENALTVELIE